MLPTGESGGVGFTGWPAPKSMTVTLELVKSCWCSNCAPDWSKTWGRVLVICILTALRVILTHLWPSRVWSGASAWGPEQAQSTVLPEGCKGQRSGKGNTQKSLAKGVPGQAQMRLREGGDPQGKSLNCSWTSGQTGDIGCGRTRRSRGLNEGWGVQRKSNLI